MNKELIKVHEPQLPILWNYDESVKVGKQLFIRWKDITIEMAEHFYIARGMLKSKGGKPFHKSYKREITPVRDWGDYCQEVSSIKDKKNARDAFNRMLNLFFPLEYKQLSSPIIEGEFDIIYADPPWKYDFSRSKSRTIEGHYPTMTVEEIGNYLNKIKLYIKDGVLFIWATKPKLTEAFEIIKEWKFDYKTLAVWDKVQMGMGYYFRSQIEILLVATRGKGIPPRQTDRFSDLIVEKRSSRHSRKPQKAYEIIENMYPNQKKIELFATMKRRGWIPYGNEIQKDK